MKILFRNAGSYTLMIFLLFAFSVTANNGLTLLQINHGARQAGMASAVVSFADDVNNIAYNPAGAIHFNEFTASFGHIAYWNDVRMEAGYFAFPFSDNITWHGGIRFAAVDNIESRLNPTLIPDNYTDYHDVSFKTGFSYRFNNKLSAGLSAGWFMEKIDAWTGSAFNVDIGTHYQATDKLAIGASAINIGPDFNLTATGKVDSRDISLPTMYSVGASYKYDQYTGAADVVIDSDQTHLQLGAEAKLHDMLSVRSGYMFNYDSKNFTAGLSFTVYETTIDYAFVPFTNNLGTAHMFTLTRGF